MASLAEDEAAQRHRHRHRHRHAPPPPAPPPAAPHPDHHLQPQLHGHAVPFPTLPSPELRAHETVINGTTWYHQAPPLSHPASDFYFPPPSPARTPPPSAAPVCPPFIRGIAPSYPGTSGFVTPYPHADRLHDGFGPSYAFTGAGYSYGVWLGYYQNWQHNYYLNNGYPGPQMSSQSPANAYGIMPRPSESHGGLASPVGKFSYMQTVQAGYGGYAAKYGFNASYEMPPHSIRTSGKTFRQLVSWCGMTMPVIITTQAAAVIDWIQRQSGNLFGFDLEWKPNRLKGEDNLAALLQICGPADCLIVQLLYTDMIPKLLKEFLFLATKQLGGVGIRQDVKKLERDHDLVCQGQVELGLLASEKLKREDLQGTGLKKLVDQVLGMNLLKTKKITMSNWEKEYLDEKQIEYACIDAWAAFVILQKLTAL